MYEKKGLYVKKIEKIESERMVKLNGHRGSVTCCCIVGNDKCFSAGKDRCIIKWDLNNLKKICVLKKMSMCNIISMDVNRENNLLCFNHNDNNIAIFDIRENKVIKIIDNAHMDKISGLSFNKSVNKNKNTMEFSDDESYNLFSTGYDKAIKYWNVKNVENIILYQTLYGHTDKILSIHDFEDNIITSSSDLTIRLWNLKKQKQLIYQNEDDYLSIDCVRMLHKDTFISGSNSNRGTLSLWSTLKNKPLYSINNVHNGEWISSLETIKYSNIFFSGSCDGFVKVWKREDNTIKKINEFNIQGWVNDIKINNSNNLLICCIGTEHRLGRWKVLHNNTIRNGLHLINLKDNNNQ